MMKWYLLVMFLPCFVFAGSDKAIVLPSLLQQPEAYATLVSGAALYNVYTIYADNKKSKAGNEASDQALKKQQEIQKLEEEVRENQIQNFEKLLLDVGQRWILLNTDQLVEKERSGKIHLLRQLYGEIADLFDMRAMQNDLRCQEIRNLFAEHTGTDQDYFKDKNLDTLYTQLSNYVYKKISILKNEKGNQNNESGEAKTIFPIRSYKASIPLLLVASLFWLPTVAKLLGYKIRLTSDVVRFSLPSAIKKELIIPQFVTDVRLWMLLLSVGGIVDAGYITAKNLMIQSENRKLYTMDVQNRIACQKWKQFTATNNKEERIRAKIHLIKEFYEQKKDILKIQGDILEAGTYNNTPMNIPNSATLNRIFQSEEWQNELEKLDETTLDFYHMLIGGSGIYRATKYLKYKRPLVWFSLSNVIGLSMIFFKNLTTHPQRF